MRHWLALLVACALLLAGSFSAAQQQGEGPAAVVERLHDALLEVMREADELGFSGRRARLTPVLGDVYDFPFISRVVLGRHWASLSDKERATMVEVFTRLTVATYADRFDGYSGERFVTRASRDLGENRAVVRTEIIGSDGEARRLDYLLERRGDRWRVVNVIADGVSDLALKRAEYSRIVGSEGFEALIAQLQAQIDDYAGKTES